MKKYRCKICGYIHEGKMPDDFVCPLCGVGKEFFEEIESEEKIEKTKAVPIDEDNPSIFRVIEKLRTSRTSRLVQFARAV